MSIVLDDDAIPSKAQQKMHECEIALLRKRMHELEEAASDALTIRGLMVAHNQPHTLFAEKQRLKKRVFEIEDQIRKVLEKRKGLKAENCKVS